AALPRLCARPRRQQALRDPSAPAEVGFARPSHSRATLTLPGSPGWHLMAWRPAMDVQHDPNRGTVLSVRGSVVDAHFPDRLPEFHTELRAGDERDIVIEVVSHLDPDTVRGVALTPTAGLARGSRIIDLGHALQVPVGERLLGRVVN